MRPIALLGVALALASSWGCVVKWTDAGAQGDDTDENGSTDASHDQTADTDLPAKPPHSGAKPADTCKASKTFGSLKEGTFTGDFSNYTASGFAPDCGSSFYAPQGIDGFYRVDLAGKQSVNVRFSVPNQDVVIYMTKGCAPLSECVGSADAGRDGAEEGLEYTNTSSNPTTIYLGVALYKPDAPGGTFSLTVTYTP